MKIVIKDTYGGIDWHDSNTKVKYMMQDGKYDIADTDLLIAQDAYREASEMVSTTKSPDGAVIDSVSLENVPSFDEFLQAIKEKRTLTVQSKIVDIYQDENGKPHEFSELEFRLVPADGCVRVFKDYMFGQASYETYYAIDEIPNERVGYIAVENFLAPVKGCPTVQRFYHEPYRTLEEAQKALDEMVMHSEENHSGLGSIKELHIVDIDKIKDSQWYKNNVASFGKPFTIFAQEADPSKEDADEISEASDKSLEDLPPLFTDEDFEEVSF